MVWAWQTRVFLLVSSDSSSCSPLQGRPGVGWSRMAPTGMTSLCSPGSPTLQWAILGSPTWLLDRVPKERAEVLKTFWRLGSEPAPYHFHHLLLTKAIHKSSPASECGRIYSTSWGGAAESLGQGDGFSGRGITVAVLLPPPRVLQILWVSHKDKNH